MFSAGSRVLHTATQFTNAPVHFSQVTVVVPEFWTDLACNESVTVPTGNTLYKHVDMEISNQGARHVVQGAECGQPGHVIKFPVTHLLDVHKQKVLGNILVSEWSKYRYGVYQESGYAGDSLYPNYYYNENQVVPTGPSNTLLTGSWRFENSSVGCDPTLKGSKCHYHVEGPNNGLKCSINAHPELESVTHWCDQKVSSGPSVQSVLCQGRSVTHLISEHSDFASYSGLGSEPTENVPPVLLPQVKFAVVRVPQPKYVLVIETSARMVGVWQWVRKAIVNLIR